MLSRLRAASVFGHLLACPWGHFSRPHEWKLSQQLNQSRVERSNITYSSNSATRLFCCADFNAWASVNVGIYRTPLPNQELQFAPSSLLSYGLAK